jgi:CubicO group peptidase (beta-lactamase class C family)
MLGMLDRRRLRRTLQALVDAHVAAGTFQGTALVARGGRTLLRIARGPGLAPDTPLRIGSIGKTFTALAIMRLVERGRLGFDDPLARFVPDFPGGAAIRLHHLLSNTSGIPDFLTLPSLQPRIAERHRLDEVIDYVRGLDPLFPPGERLSYSNTNWTLLALAIERVTGRPFAPALGELVLDPLELRNTFVDLDSGRGDLVPGHSIGDSGSVPSATIDMSLELGAGGIRSTGDDLLRLDRAVSVPGFLSAATLDRMRTPVASDGPIGYGYGLFSTARLGRPIIGHTGGTFGFTAFWSRFSTEDAVTIVLANVDNGSAERLERDLAAVLFGEPYDLPGLPTFVRVEREVLADYVGRYQSAYAGRRIDFEVGFAGDDLQAVFPLLPKARLRPLSSSRFLTRLKGGEVVFEFVRDRPGAPISKLTMDWNGTLLDCPRLS